MAPASPSPWRASGWTSWASSRTCAKSSRATPFPVGSVFTVEASRVTHTVPDAVGYIIRTPEGTVIHTGDFKLDPDPIDGLRTDLERWGEAGDAGRPLPPVRLHQLRVHPGDRQRARGGADLRSPLPRGHRAASSSPSSPPTSTACRTALKLAEQLGRKVALQGRSMTRNVEMARELGYLDVPESLFIPLESAPGLPPNASRAALPPAPRARLALAWLSSPLATARCAWSPGTWSSSAPAPSPATSAPSGALLDQLHWTGARIVYAQVEPGVHVSGHASKPQQRRVLDIVRPRHFVPVHGELRHLHRHLATAREAGLAPEQLLLAQDGDLVTFEAGPGPLRRQRPRRPQSTRTSTAAAW